MASRRSSPVKYEEKPWQKITPGASLSRAGVPVDEFNGLTPQRQHVLIEALRTGNFLNTACRLAGVDAPDVLSWVARGEGTHSRPQKEPYITFAKLYREACAKPEAKCLDRIMEIADSTDDWKAYAWFLERRFQNKWGNRTSRATISGPKGGPIQIDATVRPAFERFLETASHEQLRQLAMGADVPIPELEDGETKKNG